MRLFLLRFAGFLSVACLAFLVGCDDRKADRQVQRDVERGHDLVLQGTDETMQEARQLLQSAAANTAASPAVQANAKSLLAQVELEAARTAQRSIDQKMMDLSRLVSQMTQLAQQISTTNALIAGYRQYDPADALDAIQKNIADATGGPNQPAWFKHDDTELPTLAVLRQEMSRMQGEISGHEEQLKRLTAQRTQVLREADQLSKEADAERGGDLDAFRRASELRKQAADLATQIENVEAALVPLREDLAIAQAQEQVITGLIEQLEEQAQALGTGWQMIQKQIAAQGGLARAILQGSSAGSEAAPAGGSISDKSVELRRVIEELAALRQQALENATSAATNYAQAVQQADSLRIQLSSRINEPKNQNRSERQAWQTTLDVMHPAVFRLQQASAQRMIATIHTVEGQELGLRIELRNTLAPILETAGLNLPEDLRATNLERDREQTLAAANEAYAAADEALENVTGGQAQAEVQNAAYVARILTLYGWSQLNRLSGDPQAAEQHLNLAMEVRKTAVEREISLPTMPPGLGAPPREALPPADPAAPAAAQVDPANEPAADEPAPEPPMDQPVREPAAPVDPDPTDPDPMTDPATPAEPPAEPDPPAEPQTR